MLTKRQMEKFRKHLSKFEAIVRQHALVGEMLADEAIQSDVDYQMAKTKFCLWVKSTYLEGYGINAGIPYYKRVLEEVKKNAPELIDVLMNGAWFGSDKKGGEVLENKELKEATEQPSDQPNRKRDPNA
jgi:hypothetical protein